MHKIDGERINFIIEYPLLREVDRIAERHEVTRSEMLRRLLIMGTDIYCDFERIGVIKLAEVIRRTKKGISKEAGQLSLFE